MSRGALAAEFWFMKRVNLVLMGLLPDEVCEMQPGEARRAQQCKLNLDQAGSPQVQAPLRSQHRGVAP